MALQALHSHVLWPGRIGWIPSSSALTGTTIDASGEYSAVVIKALENMTVSHVLARCNASTSLVADLRIETVSASTGLPSGALWATNTNVAITPTANTTAIHALTASATITAGEWFAVKVLWTSGTGVMFSKPRQGMQMSSQAGIYMVENTGSPTAGALLTQLALALGSGATTFYQIPFLNSYTGDATVAFDNTAAGDQRGLRFRIPFTGSLKGVLHYVASPVAADRDLKLYSDAGSLIKSTSIDGDLASLTTGAVSFDTFDVSQTLTAGTWYRLVLAPTESGTNVRFLLRSILANSQTCMLGDMTNYHYTTYTTGGGWIDTATTDVPMWDLVFDQLDDGVQVGGGVLRNAGFSGGFV